MGTPILTFVSEGYPLRRLLIGPKRVFAFGVFAQNIPAAKSTRLIIGSDSNERHCWLKVLDVPRKRIRFCLHLA